MDATAVRAWLKKRHARLHIECSGEEFCARVECGAVLGPARRGRTLTEAVQRAQHAYDDVRTPRSAGGKKS